MPGLDQEGEEVALTPKAENTAEYWVTALEAAGAGTAASREGLINKIIQSALNPPSGSGLNEAQVKAIVNSATIAADINVD
jgi:hypothetical protein